MDGPTPIALAFALFFAADFAVLPTEKECSEAHTNARQVYCEAARVYGMFGGWHAECQMKAAKRHVDFVWAVWWVVWPAATEEQRRHWYGETLRLRFNPSASG